MKEMSKKERRKLIDAYIPADYEHYFNLDDFSLNEVFQAYTNLDDAIADRYLEYVIMCAQSANEHTGAAEVLTAKNWVKAQRNSLNNSLENWTIAKVKDIAF